MPYSITAEDSTPNRKNLIPADFRKATIRKPGADTSSSEMNSINKSREEGMRTQPRKDVRSRK